MINVLLDFARIAGQIMLKEKAFSQALKQKDATVESLVTNVDIQISNLFNECIQKNFSNLNYMIIDEETISQYQNNFFEAVKNSEYQFVIDPIDGTIQYALGHPLYGITIGVYKNAKPLLGLIYLPELQDLIYSDGNNAYHLQKAFSKDEVKTPLTKSETSDSPIIFGHSWIWNLSSQFSIQKAVFVDYYSAVSQSFYTLIGKAKAYCLYLHLWDIAGAIPIADCLGMKVFEYGSANVYDEILPLYFTNNMWTQRPCILCHPCDLKEICDFIKPQI